MKWMMVADAMAVGEMAADAMAVGMMAADGGSREESLSCGAVCRQPSRVLNSC